MTSASSCTAIPPEGAEGSQDELAWALVLRTCWPQDQRSICALLCCSGSMAKLVTHHYAGMLSAHMADPASKTCHKSASANSTAVAAESRSDACSKWLARNAVLLRSLRLDPLPSARQHVQDPYHAGRPAGATTQYDEDVAEEQDAASQLDKALSKGLVAACAAAAKTHPMLASFPAPAGSTLLPLQHLACNIPSAGHILASIGGAAQLTSLWLRMTEGVLVPGFGAALASLTSLRELTVVQSSPRGDYFRAPVDPSVAMVGVLLPALQALTGLAQLKLCPDAGAESSAGVFDVCSSSAAGVADATESVVTGVEAVRLPDGFEQYLPTSVACLSVQRPMQSDSGGYVLLDLSHLTAVTTLCIDYVREADVLPPNVEVLTFPEQVGMANMQLSAMLPGTLPNLRVLKLDIKHIFTISPLDHAGVQADGLPVGQGNNFIFVPALPIEQVTPLLAEHMIGLSQLSQIQALHLKLAFREGAGFQGYARLSAVPLVDFECVSEGSFPDAFLCELGAFTQLTRLALTHSHDHQWTGSAVRELASQLLPLPQLQELQLRVERGVAVVCAHPARAAAAAQADWQVLLEEVAASASLKRVELFRCGVKPATAQLYGVAASDGAASSSEPGASWADTAKALNPLRKGRNTLLHILAGYDAASPAVDASAAPGFNMSVPAQLQQMVDDDEDDLCVVCQEKPRSIVLVPCGHRILCKDCCGQIVQNTANDWRRAALRGDCPVCRVPVDSCAYPFETGPSASSHQSAAGASALLEPDTPAHAQLEQMVETLGIDEDEDDGQLCVVCMEDQRAITLVPCGHCVLCKDCCRQVMQNRRKCPCCHVELSDVNDLIVQCMT